MLWAIMKSTSVILVPFAKCGTLDKQKKVGSMLHGKVKSNIFKRNFLLSTDTYTQYYVYHSSIRFHGEKNSLCSQDWFFCDQNYGISSCMAYAIHMQYVCTYCICTESDYLLHIYNVLYKQVTGNYILHRFDVQEQKVWQCCFTLTKRQCVRTFESEVQNSQSALEPCSMDSLSHQHHTKK